MYKQKDALLKYFQQPSFQLKDAFILPCDCRSFSLHILELYTWLIKGYVSESIRLANPIFNTNLTYLPGDGEKYIKWSKWAVKCSNLLSAFQQCTIMSVILPANSPQATDISASKWFTLSFFLAFWCLKPNYLAIEMRHWGEEGNDISDITGWGFKAKLLFRVCHDMTKRVTTY